METGSGGEFSISQPIQFCARRGVRIDGQGGGSAAKYRAK